MGREHKIECWHVELAQPIDKRFLPTLVSGEVTKLPHRGNEESNPQPQKFEVSVTKRISVNQAFWCGSLRVYIPSDLFQLVTGEPDGGRVWRSCGGLSSRRRRAPCCARTFLGTAPPWAWPPPRPPGAPTRSERCSPKRTPLRKSTEILFTAALPSKPNAP